MKELLEKRDQLTQEVLDYFGVTYLDGAIRNHLDDVWAVDIHSVHFGEEIDVEDGFFESNYSSELRGIHRGKDYTMVISYAQMGGDNDYQIFDNSKEVKEDESED